MEEILKLQLEAVDKFAALEKMLDSLQSIDKTLLKVSADLHKVEETNVFVKLAAQINIAKAALGAFKFVLGKGLDFGLDFVRAGIDGQTFKQGTLIAFKTFFKTQAEAQKQYQHLFDVGEVTPGTAEGVKSATLKFAASGFSLPEIDTLQGLYADAQALGGTENGDNFASAISKIKNQGRLTGEALRFESIEKVGVGDILLDLGKKLKITGNPQDIKKKVNKLVSKGAIDSNLAITAIRDVSNAKLGNTKAGEYAIKLGRESLEGALSTVQESVQNLFRRLDIAAIPDLIEFLNKISDAIKDPEIKRAFEDSFNSLIAPFKDIGKDDIKSAFIAIAGYIRSAAGTIGDLIQRLKTEGLFSTLIAGSEELLKDIGFLVAEGFKIGLKDVTGEYATEYEKRKAVRKVADLDKQDSDLEKANAEQEERAKARIYGVLNGAASPLDPSKQGNFVTINVDASNAKDPEAVGEAVAKAASKVLSDHHKNTRRDKQQKGL